MTNPLYMPTTIEGKLVHLSEECAEVIERCAELSAHAARLQKAAAKALRFGPEHSHPRYHGGLTNAAVVRQEAMQMMDTWESNAIVDEMTDVAYTADAAIEAMRGRGIP